MDEVLSFEELREQLSFTEVLDNLDAGIIIFDAKGDFLFMNTVMINWRNIPRREYLTMNVHDFNSVLDICVFDLVCQQKRRVSRLQYYRDFQKIDSNARVRIVTGTPIFDANGNIKYVVMLLQDIADFEKRYHTLLDQHNILSGDASLHPETEKVCVVAKSQEILQLLSVTDNIAPLDSTVLLHGESGTGKEVFARYIHQHSNRKDNPLITVNCAALPENLIEAELFGYEKGSFTGATREGKVGFAEAADGGTLFLDEINSLPLSLQGKVLRMIEDKSVQRIGAIRAKKVNFRLITATNRDLAEMVHMGTFREDLYYRLHVIPLIIPPLRNRKDDIVPLCLHFLHDFCQKYNLQKSFSDAVLREVKNYEWPGNVRELRNFVERMVVMTPYAIQEIKSIPHGMLKVSTASQDFVPEKPAVPVLPSTALTREKLLAALELCNNRRKETAAYLGISRRQLQYKIKQFHLSTRCEYTVPPATSSVND